MDKILTAVAVISVIILAVTGMIKSLIPDNKLLPIINVVVGIFIGLLYAATIVGSDLATYCWAGAISGLAAGGFYDLGANAKGLVKQSKAKDLEAKGLGQQEPTYDKDGKDE